MKRKTLAVSLSAILAASMLFGCGSNSKSGDTKSSSDNGSASASAADASNAGSDASGSGIQYDGDDVTITYWHTHGDSEEVTCTTPDLLIAIIAFLDRKNKRK